MYKSGYFPKVLGILMMIRCFGYIIGSYGSIFVTGNGMMLTATNIFLMFATIGELGFTFYLLIKGIKETDLSLAIEV